MRVCLECISNIFFLGWSFDLKYGLSSIAKFDDDDDDDVDLKI